MSETRSINEMIGDALKKWGNERISNARSILDRAKANASRNLWQGLKIVAIDVQPNNIQLKIGFEDGQGGVNGADYYKYIDEGVKGIGGGKRSAITTGKYSFKTPFVGRKMAKSIQTWIAQKPIQVRTSKSQSKQDVIKQAEQLSYVIARSIKKTGIGRTMFWSDTFNDEAFSNLADMIEKELGGQFKVQIKI